MVGIIERAFQLAPQCRNMNELSRKLLNEGYGKIEVHLQSGSSLAKQLRQVMPRDGSRGETKATPDD